MVATCCYRLRIKLAATAHTRSLQSGRTISGNCWITRIKQVTDRKYDLCCRCFSSHNFVERSITVDKVTKAIKRVDDCDVVSLGAQQQASSRLISHSRISLD